MPTDATSLTEEDFKWLANNNGILSFRYGEHTSHYGTCRNPEEFRKNYDNLSKQKSAKRGITDSNK